MGWGDRLAGGGDACGGDARGGDARAGDVAAPGTATKKVTASRWPWNDSCACAMEHHGSAPAGDPAATTSSAMARAHTRARMWQVTTSAYRFVASLATLPSCTSQRSL